MIILIVEITIGYAIYLKNSNLISGHYVSATFKGVSKINQILKKFKNEDDKENLIKLEFYRENFKNNFEDKKCQDYRFNNQHIKLSGIRSLRRPLEIQTDIDFLNNFNKDKHYLIYLIGNSETNGSFQDFEKRLHTLIQKNLRNKLNTDNIFVVNISNHAGMLSDHLNDLFIYSRLYEPDLTIFYTGGNELLLKKFYREILDGEITINKENFIRYNFEKNSLINPNNIRFCLNGKKFLNNRSFTRSTAEVKISEHFKHHFYNIKNELNKKDLDFLFYIQPILEKYPYNDFWSSVEMEDVNILKNLNIDSKNYINLNFTNIENELKFVDLFHTSNAKIISNIISEDITSKFLDKIVDKIK